MNDGTMFTFGSNKYGQLGLSDGNADQRNNHDQDGGGDSDHESDRQYSSQDERNGGGGGDAKDNDEIMP